MKIYQGDMRVALRSVESNSIHAVVTSPPYFHLRKYGLPPLVWADGWSGELGWEPRVEQYAEHLVECFREVWRVLRDDGAVWLNLGTSAAGSGKGPTGRNGIGNHDRRQGFSSNGTHSKVEGFKQKDLIQVPFFVSEALRQDGWWLRSAIPWLKRSGMPESVRDRPVMATEYVYLLTKSASCYYDQDAVRQPGAAPERVRRNEAFGGKNGHLVRHGQQSVVSGQQATRQRRNSDWFFESWQGLLLDEDGDPLALVVNPTALKEEHYAAMPVKLIEPMLRATTSERGCCPACGAPWLRQTRTIYRHHERWFGDKQAPRNSRGTAGTSYDEPIATETLGWQPGCAHYDERYRTDHIQARSARKRYQRQVSGDWWRRVRQRPGKNDWLTRRSVVLDPFSGAGTTLLAADRLGRDGIGCELSETYSADLSANRLIGDAPMFAQLELM